MTGINRQRRAFLLLAGSLCAGSALGTTQFPNTIQNIYSASADKNNNYFLSRINLSGHEKTSIALPFRAHDVLPLNAESAIAFGRRPALQSAHVNFKNKATRLIEATKGRHFYGHGCLSANQSVLFTTENDYGNARGVIGLRDADTFSYLGEYSSHGVGPHDIHLLPDGKTLVVANGGIQTHPDFGRRKLNLQTMQPSLVYIDASSGRKLDEYRLDDHLLSIRHLTVTAEGDVGVATQYQGDIYRQQPDTLVAWQTRGGSLRPLTIPGTALSSCRGYMADLAYNPQQHLLAVTTPRGNRITLWDTHTYSYRYSAEIPEVSGIQFLPEHDAFLVSNAQGKLYTVKAGYSQAHVKLLAGFDDTQWDNHLFLS